MKHFDGKTKIEKKKTSNDKITCPVEDIHLDQDQLVKATRGRLNANFHISC